LDWQADGSDDHAVQETVGNKRLHNRASGSDALRNGLAIAEIYISLAMPTMQQYTSMTGWLPQLDDHAAARLLVLLLVVELPAAQPCPAVLTSLKSRPIGHSTTVSST
jgi:hypothetical protein